MLHEPGQVESHYEVRWEEPHGFGTRQRTRIHVELDSAREHYDELIGAGHSPQEMSLIKITKEMIR